jgi:plastocyanin
VYWVKKALGTAAVFMASMALSAQATDITVVDERGTPVPDAIVVWEGALSQRPTEVIVDQLDKHFVPYVTMVPPGTAIRFPNSDDIRHHVYSFSDAKTFELKLYHANDAEPVLFDRAGLVTLGCNVHDTMKGYILVSDQPGVVTADNGIVVVPDGVDMVRVWHPQLGEWLQRSVTSRLELPMAWDSTDPQAARDRSTLEQRMMRFRREN